jgi:hypothetical protein
LAAAEPADTYAPKAAFADGLHAINKAFVQLHGSPLFREHDTTQEILKRVHWFRAVEPGGLLALAKDVARLTADSIDISFLRKVAPQQPEGKSWGSLKLTENYPMLLVGAGAARSIMSPLVGVYELRLGDAHLPSEKLQEAFALPPIDMASLPLVQGFQLLPGTVGGLQAIHKSLQQQIEDQQRASSGEGAQHPDD